MVPQISCHFFKNLQDWSWDEDRFPAQEPGKIEAQWACKLLTRWNTCSLRMSFSLAFRSLTRVARSSSLSLSLRSMALESPTAMSRVSRMPPLGAWVDSQLPRPLLDDGVKQTRCSPASAAVKVNLLPLLPRCETTRWSLSKTSYRGRVSIVITVIVRPSNGDQTQQLKIYTTLFNALG